MATFSPASSSSIAHSRKFGVFLSFRGADTRDKFVSHLYDALCRQGVPTFMDSEKLDKGKEISAILNAIEESKVSVIVFSKNYASSPWCLDELVKIMECKKTNGLKVLPVFYHVDPADVENQTGRFGEAFSKHEVNFEENKGMVQSWRTALREAACIAGWDSKEIRPESALIRGIIKGVLDSLRHLWSKELKDLVGMHQRIEQIESLLSIGLADVRIVGVWGMGGIGKTTLARVVFEKYSCQFEGSCFLANVREESDRRGLRQLQDELIDKILNDGNNSNKTMDQLRYKKVLIVLDDVDSFAQLECLAGKRDWFGAGSRIIVTSRDRQVLKNGDDIHDVYEFQPLVDREALQLFTLFAFKGKGSSEESEDHLKLVKKFANYARGNPLALKVLGLFLHGRNRQEWESTLHKLERSPNKDVQKVLSISYEGLDFHDQQLFLDIACFFKGQHKSKVERILDACGFFTSIGLGNLADKSLITMSGSIIEMHDLLQEMGWQIVRQEDFKEPGRRSRLHNYEDVQYVLSKNTGTEQVEGISMDLSKITRLHVSPTAFARMNQVKYLNFYDAQYDESLSMKLDLQCPRGLECLPDELRYLRWEFYPLKSLPGDFNAEYLVFLDLCYSKVERLWAGVQNLPNLKEIILYKCKQLIEMPDFSCALNLETMDFSDCTSLLEVSPSVEHLVNLKSLSLENCKKIRSIPSTANLRSLIDLNLNGCAIDLSLSIRELSGLRKLTLCDYTRLGNLTNYLGCLTSLRQLDLTGSNIEFIPTSIKNLLLLEYVLVSNCFRLQSLPQLPPHVNFLDASGCMSLEIVSSSRFTQVEDQDTHGEFLPGFYFINCRKLSQSARRNILNFMQQRLMLMANSIRQLAGRLRRNQFTFLFPGKDIPVWIKAQSRGSSITIQLPDNWCSSNFLGFALCLVLENNNMDYPLWWTKYECQLKPKNGETNREIVGQVETIHSVDPVCDHVFLWYTTHFQEMVRDRGGDWFNDCNNYNEAFFEFRSQGPYPIKVKKCGVRLLYADEGDPSTDETSSCEWFINNYEDEAEPSIGTSNSCEEDMEPHPKRGKFVESTSRTFVKDAAHLGPSSAENLLVSAEVPAAVDLVGIEENWVCCDSCQKWRLLPLGTKPEHLPEKWLCGMLHWLPGMNRCDVSEEETTRALHALYQHLVAAGPNCPRKPCQ